MNSDRTQSNDDGTAGQSNSRRMTFDEIAELTYENDDGVVMTPSADSPLPDGSINFVPLPEPSNEPIPVQAEALGDSTPDDAFVLASTIFQEQFTHYTKFKRFLSKHPEIRTRKPSKQRLLIHAGDWYRYWRQQEQKDCEALDATRVGELIDGIEHRKEQIRRDRDSL